MAYTEDEIGGFYQKYLGRAARPGEATGWTGHENAEEMIKGSGEGQAFAKSGKTDAGGGWSGVPQQSNTQVAGTAPMGGAAGGPGPTFSGDYRDYFNQLFPGGNITPMELAAKAGDLAKVGITIHKSTSGDNIRLPDGRLVDVIQDAGPTSASKNIKAWQVEGSGGGGGGGAAGGGGGAGGGFAYGNAGQRDALFNTLLGRSQQSLALSGSDPNIRAQADPYAANIERERRRYMADTAERMGPLANIQGESRLASEKAGQASGLFESQLVGREMQARRDEIAQALASMQGMLSQEQQLAMQRELAQLDASIRNRQISSGNEQFMGSLGLQSENQANYWDALRSGLIGG